MGDKKSSDTSMSKAPSASSFLSGFLSDTPEPAPYASAPEDAKISDRSAFNKQSFSIEEIVSGSGVSNIDNFPISQPAPAIRTRPRTQTRESAIPLTPPKRFTGHSLASFPDKSPHKVSTSTPIRRKQQVEPTTYTSGTFSAFRSLSTSTNWQWQTQRHLSTTSCLKQHTTPPTEPEKPAATPQSNFHHQPESTPRTSTPIRMRVPATKMSQKQLLENKEYRNLRKNWTLLIVGLPFLVVSSYFLYQRLDEFDQEKKEKVVLETTQRQRGVVPGHQVRSV